MFYSKKQQSIHKLIKKATNFSIITQIIENKFIKNIYEIPNGNNNEEIACDIDHKKYIKHI
tara:strand:+ start:53 stop:235 length:183 start_codon:yes stop_codon:yes gene_type:complete